MVTRWCFELVWPYDTTRRSVSFNSTPMEAGINIGSHGDDNKYADRTNSSYFYIHPSWLHDYDEARFLKRS